MWSYLDVLDNCQKLPLLAHILDVFSRLRNRIELIPFALSQGSRDTSLDYPQGLVWRQQFFTYFDATPLLWGLEFNYFGRKIGVSIIIGNRIRFL
jgi:hypothetical protein